MVRSAFKRDWSGTDTRKGIISWENFNGIDLISDNTQLNRGRAAYALNADFFTKPGSVTKSMGFGKIISGLSNVAGSCVAKVAGVEQLLLFTNASMYSYPGGYRQYNYNTSEMWGTGPTSNCAAYADGTLNSPFSIVTDDSYFYISENSNHRIVKIRISDFSLVATYGTYGTGVDNLKSPSHLALYGGTLYICDTGNNRIVALTASTMAKLETFGTSGIYGSYGIGDDNFNNPTGICVCGSSIIVADTDNHRIKKHHRNTGAYEAKIGSYGTSGHDYFNYPCAVIDCNTSHVLVSDTFNDRIMCRLVSDLSWVSETGSAGSGDGQFNKPYGITYVHGTSPSALYVTDRGNNRLQKFSIGNTTKAFTYVSKVGKSDYTTGSGIDEFSSPYGCCKDAQGRIVVCDNGNNRLSTRLASTLSFYEFSAQYGDTTPWIMKLSATSNTGNWTSGKITLGDTVYGIRCVSDVTYPTNGSVVIKYLTSSDDMTWSSEYTLASDGIPTNLDKYIKFKLYFTRNATGDGQVSCDVLKIFVHSNFDTSAQTTVSTYATYATSGQAVRTVNYKNKLYIANGGKPLVYDGTTIKKLGAAPPALAPTMSAAAVGEGYYSDGTYYFIYTYVYADGSESDPSPYGTWAPSSMDVYTARVTFATGSTDVVARKIYRTQQDPVAGDDGPYYLVATVENNSDTIYDDYGQDDSIHITNQLLDDTHQQPPATVNICLHKDVMFYVDADDQTKLWYSKPGEPYYVVNNNDYTYKLEFPGNITMLYSFADTLFVSGEGFTKFITGSLFSSDITVSDINVKHLGEKWCVNQDSVSILNTSKGPSALAILANDNRVYAITPTQIPDIFLLPPISALVRPITDSNIPFSDTQLVAYNDVLYVLLNSSLPEFGSSTSANYTGKIVLEYSMLSKEWQCIRPLPIKWFLPTERNLYALYDFAGTQFLCEQVTAQQNLVWGDLWGGYWGERLVTSIDSSGTAIATTFELDSGYKNTGTNKNRVRYAQIIVSEDSDPTSAVLTVNVDGITQTITLGSISSWNQAAPALGYGYYRQDALVSPLLRISLPPGRFVGFKLVDSSSNPLTLYAVEFHTEQLYHTQGGL